MRLAAIALCRRFHQLVLGIVFDEPGLVQFRQVDVMEPDPNPCQRLVGDVRHWPVVNALDDCGFEVVHRDRLVRLCKCRKDGATMRVVTDVENRVELGGCPIHTLL